MNFRLWLEGQEQEDQIRDQLAVAMDMQQQKDALTKLDIETFRPTIIKALDRSKGSLLQTIPVERYLAAKEWVRAAKGQNIGKLIGILSGRESVDSAIPALSKPPTASKQIGPLPTQPNMPPPPPGSSGVPGPGGIGAPALEAFDTVHRMTPMAGRGYVRSFTIGNWRYDISARSDAGGNWTIVFSADDGNDNSATDPYGLAGVSQLTAEKSKTAPPAIKVFAGIRQFMDSFIREKQPISFDFSADKKEASRVSLYNLMSQRLAQSYGYTFQTYDDGINVHFMFERPEEQGVGSVGR